VDSVGNNVEVVGVDAFSGRKSVIIIPIEQRRDSSCDFKGLLPISLKSRQGLSHKRGMLGTFLWREYKRPLPRPEKYYDSFFFGVLEFGSHGSQQLR
jgi:hypothetical protein